jgi:hypothetical protein
MCGGRVKCASHPISPSAQSRRRGSRLEASSDACTRSADATQVAMLCLPIGISSALSHQGSMLGSCANRTSSYLLPQAQLILGLMQCSLLHDQQIHHATSHATSLGCARTWPSLSLLLKRACTAASRHYIQSAERTGERLSAVKATCIVSDSRLGVGGGMIRSDSLV